ncbi:ubiquitin-like domain-containing protein [Effusibacillus dendaii]|uniref:G5 domain-containing protein n=1 Tax=Effusibacillus dendaii TaxID=2743772 RepID=A0A7I8D8D3_9BACL|nr:ubiquitin-like domain-containing protein [Effusibacillus dendaii]BCJ85066.1 hypothetical protein skT53_00510 [Effusibacillus dendaii]
MSKFSRRSISLLAAALTVTAAGSGTALSLHKTVQLNVDGQNKRVSGFFRGSIEQFLHEQGIAAGGQDMVQPPKNFKVADGMSIIVRHAREVTIQDGDKQPQKLVTTATSVADLLKQAGIQLGKEDRVNVELSSVPTANQTISITRREVQVAVTEEPIPFQTERQPDQSIIRGQEKTLTPGVEGLAKVTTRIVMENGIEQERHVDKEVIKEPVNAVVAYGTKPMVVASRSGESFAAARQMYMSATGYVGGGRTATGRVAEYGIAAVDPNVIPLGTKLYIEGYGYALAADTGGDIRGNRIDLVFNSMGDALQFGRRQVTVYIVE